MGAMNRPVPGDEPALKSSDLACEATFDDYVASHERAGLDAARGAYKRRRGWLAWRLRLKALDVDAMMAPHVRELLATHPEAAPSDAWAFASKAAVASLACVGPAPRVESAAERLDRRARSIADKARRAA